MSIQLQLGGHSFCPSALPEAAAGAEVACELLGIKTLLLPREEFDPTAAEALLEAAGIGCAADECAVWSDPEREALALMACDAQAVRTLRARYGEALYFTSPLLHRPTCASKCVWLGRYGALLYIKVYRDGLRLAEVTVADGEADLLYCVELLGRAFPLREFELCLAGEVPQAEAKLLRRYFNRVRH